MSYTEAELAQVRRELHDERVRRDEWEKMYHQAIAGTEVKRLQAELNRVRQDAQDQSDEVQQLWLSPCEAEGLRRQLTKVQLEHDEWRRVAQQERAWVRREQGKLADARRVARLWFRRAHEPMVEVKVTGKEMVDALQAERALRREAELTAHVHDKACGELAQTVHTERQLRREAEQRADDFHSMLLKIHEALDTYELGAYDEHIPDAQTRISWLGQLVDEAEQRAERAEAELERGHRTLTQLGVPPGDGNDKLTMRIEQMIRNERARCTERAEALAALVNEETAELLILLALTADDSECTAAAEDARDARALAAKIREALDDSQT